MLLVFDNVDERGNGIEFDGEGGSLMIMFPLVRWLSVMLPLALFCAVGDGKGTLAVEGLIGLNGEQLSWEPSGKGRICVVVFTTHECPVANRSVPDLNDLFQRFTDLEVDYLLVYTDPEAELEEVREHHEAYGLLLPAVFDARHQLVEALGASMTPEVFVFDRDAKLTYQGRINDRFSDFGKARPKPVHHDLNDVLKALVQGEEHSFHHEPGFGCLLLKPLAQQQ